MDIAITNAVVIQNQNNRPHILLVKYNDIWQFPSGKLNRMEEMHDACCRNCMEQTGIDIKPYCGERPLTVRSGAPVSDNGDWVIATAYLALLPTDDDFPGTWFTVEDVLRKSIPLAFDHYDVLDYDVPNHIKGLL